MTDLAPTLVLVDEHEPPNRHVNALLYGPPKHGKTVAASTAPGPILWLNPQGKDAIAYARRVAARRRTTIHEVRPETHAPLRPVLLEIVRYAREQVVPVETVVVDTIGDVRNLLAHEYRSARDQWQRVTADVMGFVLALRDLPVNLVLLAHEEPAAQDTPGAQVRPLIGGSLTERVCGEMQLIARCAPEVDDDGTTTRWLGHLAPGYGFHVGDRSGGALGNRRELDLTDWIATYVSAIAGPVDEREETLFGPAPPPAGGPAEAIDDTQAAA